MSNSFHSITIVGNLGREPELRYTPSGQPVCSMSIATTRTYSNGAGEKVEEVCWFRASIWGKAGENAAQYLHKGSKVALVDARLVPDKQGNPRIWKKSDDTPGASFEVTCNTVHFLSKSNGGGEGAEAEVAEEQGEEIPF